MSWLKLIIGPITDAFNGWRERKHEIKLKKHDLKRIEIESEANIKVAKAEAEVRAFAERQTADINWELLSIKNSSWRDEYLTIVTTAILLATFLPWTQEYVAQGFDVLTHNTPVWFQAMVAIVWGSAFGVRVFTNFKSLVTNK